MRLDSKIRGSQFTNCLTDKREENSLSARENFGVKPKCLEVSVNKEGSLRMTLTSDSSVASTSSQASKKETSHSQICYILDRFVVSDEAYHELSSVSDLPPLHHIKRKRLAMNAS